MKGLDGYASSFKTERELILERNRLLVNISKYESAGLMTLCKEDALTYMKLLMRFEAVIQKLLSIANGRWEIDLEQTEFECGVNDEDEEDEIGDVEWKENASEIDMINYWQKNGYRAELYAKSDQKYSELVRRLKLAEKKIRETRPFVRVKDGVKDYYPLDNTEPVDFSGFTGHLINIDTYGQPFVLFDEDSQRRLPESYKQGALKEGTEWDSYVFTPDDLIYDQ